MPRRRAQRPLRALPEKAEQRNDKEALDVDLNMYRAFLSAQWLYLSLEAKSVGNPSRPPWRPLPAPPAGPAPKRWTAKPRNAGTPLQKREQISRPIQPPSRALPTIKKAPQVTDPVGPAKQPAKRKNGDATTGFPKASPVKKAPSKRGISSPKSKNSTSSLIKPQTRPKSGSQPRPGATVGPGTARAARAPSLPRGNPTTSPVKRKTAASRGYAKKKVSPVIDDTPTVPVDPLPNICVSEKPAGKSTVKFGSITVHHIEIAPSQHLHPVKLFHKTRSGLPYLNPPHDKSHGKTIVKFPFGKETRRKRHLARQEAMGKYWKRTEEEDEKWRAQLTLIAEEETGKYQNEPSGPPTRCQTPEGARAEVEGRGEDQASNSTKKENLVGSPKHPRGPIISHSVDGGDKSGSEKTAPHSIVEAVSVKENQSLDKPVDSLASILRREMPKELAVEVRPQGAELGEENSTCDELRMRPQDDQASLLFEQGILIEEATLVGEVSPIGESTSIGEATLMGEATSAGKAILTEGVRAETGKKEKGGETSFQGGDGALGNKEDKERSLPMVSLDGQRPLEAPKGNGTEGNGADDKVAEGPKDVKEGDCDDGGDNKPASAGGAAK